YVLLLEAMKETKMAAVGKFVLWGKENLCLIRPYEDSLALETLFFGEDVRSHAEIEEAVHETEVNDAELTLARQVIESITGEFDPEEFKNEYREDVREMLEAKVSGQEIARRGSVRSELFARRRGRDGLQLRLEERLVDLALVDRNAFLAADLEDFLPLDSELLRQLLRRQVVGHGVSFWFVGMKKPACASR